MEESTFERSGAFDSEIRFPEETKTAPVGNARNKLNGRLVQIEKIYFVIRFRASKLIVTIPVAERT